MPSRPLDHHVHRIGAGELLVDAARRIERLLAVGHLVGEPVARRQVGEGGPEEEEQGDADDRIEIRPVHHAVDDLADDGAKAVHQRVGRRVVLGQRLLVADEHHREDRQHENDGDERDADGDGAGLAEGADQPRLGEQQGKERQQGDAVRQHAGGSDDGDGKAHRLEAVVAFAQPDADGRHHLHAVGKAHDHDQRGHDVEEEVQLEAHPAEDAERPDHRQHRGQRRHQHQRYAPEEDDGDDGAEQQPEAVVEDLIALDGVADLQLHHRGAGHLGGQARVLELLVDGGVDLADDHLGGLFLHHLAIERDDDHRQLAVVGKELALDDVVGLEGRDHRIVGGTVLRQFVGHERRGIAGRIGLGARRQHGDEPGDAVDELQLRRQSGKRLELLALQEVGPLDHDQHIVLAGGKALVDRLVAAEFLGVGAKQFGKGIVDLQPQDAHEAEDGGNDDEDGDERGGFQRNEAEPFQAQRKHEVAVLLFSVTHGSPVGALFWAFA